MDRLDYTIGLYEKAMPGDLSWGERLETAKRHGYDFVEISIDESDFRLARLYANKREWLSLKRAIEDAGMPIDTMCLSAHRKYPLGAHSFEARDKGMDIMSRALEFAHCIGIRLIQLAGYDTYYVRGDQSTKEAFAQNISKAADLAASAGIMMGFETMETDFMDTVEKAMELVGAINSPYLGIYPDCGNLTNAALLYGHGVTADMEKGRGKIIAMHLKETAPGIYREMEYGKGHVNFKECINKALDLGVRKFVAEFWYKDEANWENTIDGALTFFEGYL